MTTDISNTGNTTEHAGRVALVTGGNKGIGLEIVRQLAQQGFTTLLAARDPGRRDAAVADLVSHGLPVEPVALDVTDAASAAAAAADVERRFGRLDVLVNNAGMSGGYEHQQPSRLDLDLVRTVFETNLFGVMTVTNAMLPLLRKSPAAAIVNVSSSVGSLGLATTPDSELSGMAPSGLYVPTKTALNSLTVQYAKELATDRIPVNAINPGFCDTDFNGHRGTVSPSDGAAVAVRYATIAPDGPTGGYFGAEGPIPW